MGVRARFSPVPPFLFLFSFLFSLFPSWVQPAEWAHSAKFTLFLRSALRGVPIPFWWARTQVSDPGLSAGHPQQAPWECGRWFLEFLRNKLARNLAVHSKAAGDRALKSCHLQSAPGCQGKRAGEAYVKEALLWWKEMLSGKQGHLKAAWQTARNWPLSERAALKCLEGWSCWRYREPEMCQHAHLWFDTVYF